MTTEFNAQIKGVKMRKSAQGSYNNYRLLLVTLLGSLIFGGTSALAETSRGFIGPHEYSLPDHLEQPLNIFVQYGYFDHNDRKFNSDGNKVPADDTETFVGLSKFVHAWNLESHPNIGIGWEVIAPEVGVRNLTQRKSVSGLGDPIAGAFAWYKPYPNVTLGADLLLLQIPVGNSSVGGGDRWRGIQSVFWDTQVGNFDYTGDFTWDIPGKSAAANARAGRTISTEHRFAYKVTSWLEPYVGVDWEQQRSSSINPQNGETDLAIGSMFYLSKQSHIAVHWSQAVAGKNRTVTNSLNARFVFFW